MKTSTLRNQNILATFRRHSPWLILMMVMLLTTGFARALGGGHDQPDRRPAGNRR